MRPKPYTAPPFFPDVSLGDPTCAANRVRGYYQVREYTCGFASTLTVLHGFRRFADPEEVYRQLGTDRSGTRQTAIVRTLRHYGLSASPRYDLDFEAMARQIRHGSLLVVYHHRLEHWLVLFGYARDPERVFVADSLPGHKSEHPWTEFGPKLNNFAIVCRPRRKSAVRLEA